MYDNLLQPINLGPTPVRNRIFNPPHGTTLGHQGVVTEDLIAYHEIRAKGGVGLIIMESMTLHPSYGFEEAFLYAGSDRIIPGLKRLAQSCRAQGTPVFGQLFHAGRGVRLSHDGSRPLSYSASDIPDERYRVVPVPMSNDMVWEMIHSYIDAAGRLAEADLDGVEILASMGYLIAQFLNPYTNRREDEFGGSFDNRLRLLYEIVQGCRKRIGNSKTLGIRITLDEKADNSLSPAEVIRICQALENDVDYFSVISGSSATPNGWVHVFPPMAVPHGFVINDAACLKEAIDKPVLVAGRINQPQLADSVVSEGKADMVGMARALITDPQFVNKFKSGRAEEIRACIGCNQACVGHRLAHFPISCIQNPASGREAKYPVLLKSNKPRRVAVVGGGPGGMKAAAIAAERGHDVVLYEKAGRLGGQVNLAEALPGRSEFGGVTTNLKHELERYGVDVNLNANVDQALLSGIQPDVVIVATGAHTRIPNAEVDGVDLIDAWSVIGNQASIGNNVVIADWSCDWNGLGVAEKLARDGHSVRLVSGGSVAGESIQAIVRDQWIGVLHQLGVETINYARFFGATDGSVFFQHMMNNEAIVFDHIDTIVSCFAPASNNRHQWLENLEAEVHLIGDAIAPRTVEEAILEGFKCAWQI
jgi:2,4-dienoyl-CoA reductase-like NADH-dependent reductase (Old Yellow Enzyme family)